MDVTIVTDINDELSMISTSESNICVSKQKKITAPKKTAYIQKKAKKVFIFFCNFN